DDIDLSPVDLAGEDDWGLVIHDAVPQLRAHPLGIVGIEVQLAGDLLIGTVQPQEIEAQDPDSQGLMMAREDGPGQVIEAARTAVAELALRSSSSFVAAQLVLTGVDPCASAAA